MADNAQTAPVNADDVSTLGQRWYVLFIMMLVYTISIADRYVFSQVQEQIKTEMQLTDFGIGLVGGISLGLFYVTMGIPLSWLADRKNRRNLLAISITVWSAATALCGMSRNFVELLLARIGVGIGEAVLSQLELKVKGFAQVFNALPGHLDPPFEPAVAGNDIGFGIGWGAG